MSVQFPFCSLTTQTFVRNIFRISALYMCKSITQTNNKGPSVKRDDRVVIIRRYHIMRVQPRSIHIFDPWDLLLPGRLQSLVLPKCYQDLSQIMLHVHFFIDSHTAPTEIQNGSGYKPAEVSKHGHVI